jgi:lysosomal alpha-mannosidase
MDDPNLEDYNVDQKVEQFINYTLDQAKSYKTNNLIMTMGSDFQYSNAHMWFKNLDKLIYYVNQAQSKGSKVNIFYSTTACYLYSLNQANTTWTVKHDDFFPYAHRPHAFWTGYFTSRAALKNYVRRSSNILQSVRHLTVLANLYDETTYDMINNLERALGIAQHHDAVSGTERQHVANDYSKRLSKGIDLAIYAAKSSLFKLKLADNDVHYCSLLNISQCNVIENVDNFTVILYNPLPRKINYWVSIPTTSNDYVVKLNENIIESEFTTITTETFSIPERNSTAIYNLVFNCNIEPLQIYKYSVNRISKKDNIIPKRKTILNKNKLIYKKTSNNAFYVKNNYLKLYFLDGNLVQIDNLQNQLTTHLNHSFCIYQSMEGNNSVKF